VKKSPFKHKQNNGLRQTREARRKDSIGTGYDYFIASHHAA
jgi:hypothetical protein